MKDTLRKQLLIVTDEDIKKARNFYDLNDKRLEESLDAITDWCQKQEHLAEAAKYLNRGIIDRIFMIAKGSVEGTKSKIDKLLTTRGMIPEMSLNRTMEEIDKIFEWALYVPLPKLCPTDQSRVMVTQFLTDKLDDVTLLQYFRYNFLVGEYRLNFDYSLGDKFIVDMANIPLSFIIKLNPIVIKKAEVLATEGFGTRVTGIHILNAPAYVDKFLFLLKQALKDKIAKRIHVHNSYEDLHSHIPKEILPKEYGGDEQSCDKLGEQWKTLLKTEDAQNIMSDLNHLISDETKRESSKFNEEYMGMPGSFRKLNVD